MAACFAMLRLHLVVKTTPSVNFRKGGRRTLPPIYGVTALDVAPDATSQGRGAGGAPHSRRDYHVISVGPAQAAAGGDTTYMQLHLDVFPPGIEMTLAAARAVAEAAREGKGNLRYDVVRLVKPPLSHTTAAARRCGSGGMSPIGPSRRFAAKSTTTAIRGEEQSLRSVSGSYCGRAATNVGGTFEQPRKSLLSARFRVHPVNAG
jgi:hypothetical protein